MTDSNLYFGTGERWIRAENMRRGEPGKCLICWGEHGREVLHKTKVGALRHLETKHPWYWRVRQGLA